MPVSGGQGQVLGPRAPSTSEALSNLKAWWSLHGYAALDDPLQSVACLELLHARFQQAQGQVGDAEE